MKRGEAYATTVIVTVFSSDQRPRLSQTFAVKVMDPDVFKKPVVTEDCVEETPPPVMLYAVIVEPLAPEAPLMVRVAFDLYCT